MEYCKYLQFQGVDEVHLVCYKYQIDCPVRERFIGDIVIAMEKKDEIMPGDIPDFCPLKENSNGTRSDTD